MKLRRQLQITQNSLHVSVMQWLWWFLKPPFLTFQYQFKLSNLKVFSCLSFYAGMPKIDSSLVFAIWLTGNRFVNPIPWNRHESFPLLSIRHAGSRFARDATPCESSRVVTCLIRIDWSLLGRVKKCCRFDSFWSNRHESFLLLSIHHAGSRFARDATPCESSRVVKCLIRIDWSLLPRFKN